MSSRDIKAIIFDLGGVLYDIDTNLSRTAFAELGLENFGDLYSLQGQEEIFDRLEVGKLPEPEFFAALNKHVKIRMEGEDIIWAWNALLIGMEPEIPPMLMGLKERYTTALLSNTNRYHAAHINNEMIEDFSLGGLRSLFHHTFLSHLIGLRKPDPAIYAHVLKEMKIPGENCVFIDDNPANVEAARKAGIWGIHKPKTLGIQEIVDNIEGYL